MESVASTIIMRRVAEAAVPKETSRGRIKKITKEEEASSDLDGDNIYLNETAQHLHRATNDKVWCKSTHCTNPNWSQRRFRRTRE